jgi:uncharacterized protein involved in outer membrane biogenesis
MALRKKRIFKIISVAAGIVILCLVAALYFQYVALKRVFIDRISYKLSGLLGQKVDIGDIHFSAATGINIIDFVIENPEGFEKGRLLKVKKTVLQLKYGELTKGTIAFRTIEINRPELTLAKDKSGRLNISDDLRRLLSKKSTLKYEIDELKIRSGSFDMDKNELYHNTDITVTLRHLSSEPGIKTNIDASAASPGKSKVSLKGWAYLGGDPKKMDLFLSWNNVRLSLFKQIAAKETESLKRSKVDISVHAAGDTRKGISFKAGARLKDPRFAFLVKDNKDISIDTDAFLNLEKRSLIISKAILQIADASTIRFAGIVEEMTGAPLYSAQVGISIPDLSLFNIGEGMKVSGTLASDAINIKGKFEKTMPAISGSLQLTNVSLNYGDISVKSRNTRISFKGITGAIDSLKGSVNVRAARLSIGKEGGKKKVISDADVSSEIGFRGKNLALKAGISAGKVAATLSGTVDSFMRPDRSVRLALVLPETMPADIRSAFWDVFPDSLLYTGLSGTLSANASISYGKRGLDADGEIRAKDFALEGENGEYSIGPVNGALPFHYGGKDGAGETISLPAFDRNDFQTLNEYYSRELPGKGSNRITVGSLRYGFNLLDDIVIWIERKGSGLNIDRFDANIFGGRLVGSAVVDISDGLNYRVGLLARSMSLKRLCADIEPIKGYVTGKVDGIAFLKGSGVGTTGLIGRADFWSYSAGGEKTAISGEFLRKMGGPAMKNYLGERPFDKGVISLYLKNGFLIFKEMEISHKNFFGITDLSVKVAPFNNRIAIGHLMSTIAEAATRAKEK